MIQTAKLRAGTGIAKCFHNLMAKLGFGGLLQTSLVMLVLAVPSRVLAAQDDPLPNSNSAAQDFADGSTNNRVYVGGGLAPSALLLGNVSQHGWRGSAHVGYGYRVARGLELGADMAIYPDNFVLLPTVYVRPYIPLANDRFELGFNARAGLFLVPNTYSKVGESFGLGLDARVWLTQNLAVQLSMQGVGATGPSREVPTEDESGQVGFLALDTNLAAVFRF